MNIEDKDLEQMVQKYVLGLLRAEELNDFEEFFMSKPEVIDMIEVAQNMHLGLGQLEQSTEEIMLRNDVTSVSLLNRIKNYLNLPVPAYAFALSLVGVFSLMSALSDSKQSNNSFAQLSLVNFSTEVVRSTNGFDGMINLENTNDNLAIFIKLPSIEYQYYQAILKYKEEIIWQSTNFEPSALRDSLIVLPNTIPRQIVKLEVFGISENGEKEQVDYCHYSERCNLKE